MSSVFTLSPIPTTIPIAIDPANLVNGRLSFSLNGFTAPRTLTVPDQSGTLPLLERANVFTANQQINGNLTVIPTGLNGLTVNSLSTNLRLFSVDPISYQSNASGACHNFTYAGQLQMALYAHGSGQVVYIPNQTATDIPVVIRGAGSQSASVTQWQNSVGTQLAGFDANCNTLTMGMTVAGEGLTIGSTNTRGYDTLIVGGNNTCTGNFYGGVFGKSNTATGSEAWVVGYQNQTAGNALIFGYQSIAGSNCYVLGFGAYVTPNGSVGIGYKPWIDNANGTKRSVALKATDTAGQGTTIQLQGCTTENPYPSSWPLANIESSWADPAHASRKARLAFETLYVATAQEGLRIDAGTDQARVGIGGAVVSGQRVTMYAGVATDVVGVFKGAASQTADLLQGQNSVGTVLVKSTADGGLVTAGDVECTTVGKGLELKSGTGQRAGNATLVGGTVTVTNTTVTANTIVMLSRKTIGGTAGNLTYTLSAGASFTINSDNALDTSVVSYFLLELN